MFDTDHEPAPAHAPLVRIIPFGHEATVSYGGGTAQGPAAIIAAAPQVELFDDELWCEPIRFFRTEVANIPPPAPRTEDALDQLSAHVRAAIDVGAFPLVLGGEHSITPGAIRPLVDRHGRLTLLHFDAHADLRDGYDGEHFSHAAAIRRCLDDDRVSVVSFGIRNISRGEVPFLEANRDRVRIHWARDRARWDIEAALEPLRDRPVFITFDLDGFDGSVMPATGTPEPGGLFWDDVMPILRRAAEVSDIVGADVVELAPRPELHACDFLAAKLCYKLLSFRFAQSSRAQSG